MWILLCTQITFSAGEPVSYKADMLAHYLLMNDIDIDYVDTTYAGSGIDNDNDFVIRMIQ